MHQSKIFQTISHRHSTHYQDVVPLTNPQTQALLQGQNQHFYTSKTSVRVTWNRTTAKLCSLYPQNNFPQREGGNHTSQHICTFSALFLWKFRRTACQVFFPLRTCAGCCIPEVRICQNHLCTHFCTPCLHRILGCYDIKRTIKMQNRIVMSNGYLCDCKIAIYIHMYCCYVVRQRGSMCSVALF